MSRILFAAARGARIKRLWFKMRDEPYNWEIAHEISVAIESDYDYRIHPEDEHLQYGPISTALREFSKHAGRFFFADHTDEVNYGVIKATTWIERCAYDESSELHRALFLLFAAEMLADEGM